MPSREWACISCGEIRSARTEPYGYINGDRFCGRCNGTRVHTCITCGEYFIVTSWSTGGKCGSCMPNNEPYRVHNYSHRPTFIYKKSERDLEERALHFGTEVELEMNGRRESLDPALLKLSELDSKHSLFYCKADSSIDNGFEIVSHPFTLDWMNENLDAFDALFEMKNMMKGWESDNCGMHVHMSLDAFTGLHMMKFMRFFYMNESLIRNVSRRPREAMSRWASMNKPEDRSITKYALKKAGHAGTGHGDAINTENSKTIEIRVFRSTLAPVPYYGNIEFLQAMFDYTKGCGLHELQEERFLSFVKDRGKAYSNFIKLTETLRPSAMVEGEEQCA